MKSFKRYLTVILMLVIIHAPTSALAAQAAYSYSAEAQTLKDLGLYNGVSTDTFNPDLGTALSRETGVVMLLRIFGLEADALALTDADTILAKFTDASTIADWAKKQVAYAVKNGLVKGTSDTTFAPSAALEGKAYCTLILRQLGFADAAYDTAPSTLAEKGGLTADEATKFTARELVKDDLVGISFGALSATDKDGKKVIDTLVADKVVDEAAVKDSGIVLVPAPIPVPETIVTPSTSSGSSHHHSSTPVISISGIDNTPVDLGHSSLPFTVSPADAVINVTNSNPQVITNVATNTTGDTLTLEFDAVHNGTSTVTFTITKDGYSSASKQIVITVGDIVPPTVLIPAQKSSIATNGSISITFSEPLNDTSIPAISDRICSGLRYADNTPVPIEKLSFNWDQTSTVLTVSIEGVEAFFYSENDVTANITDLADNTTNNAILVDMPGPIQGFSIAVGNNIIINLPAQTNVAIYNYLLSTSSTTHIIRPLTGETFDRDDALACVQGTELLISDMGKWLGVFALDAQNKVIGFSEVQLTTQIPQ